MAKYLQLGLFLSLLENLTLLSNEFKLMLQVWPIISKTNLTIDTEIIQPVFINFFLGGQIQVQAYGIPGYNYWT